MKEKVICLDQQKNKIEVPVDKLIFRPSVYGFLIENGKILLSKQWDSYDFPGGGINIDESMEEALHREFFEETGLRIKMGAPIICRSIFFKPLSNKYRGQYWNCLMTYFLVEKIGGELSTDYLDEDEKTYAGMAEWIDLKDLKKLKLKNSAVDDEFITAVMNLA